MKHSPLGAALLLSLFWGCDQSEKISGTNDETTTSVATIFGADGKPAAGARVQVYAARDTHTTAQASGLVDVNGHVVLASIPAKGWYNLVVRDGSGRALLEDSLLSDGNRLTIFSDTLRRTGKLVGRIHVQPQDLPSIAWVQLLGAGRYVNLDDSGRFTLDSVPTGKYTVAGLTRAPLYTPTFREVRIFADSTVDLGTLNLIYTGIPMVTGIHARWDSVQATATVTWDSVATSGVLGYSIYRGSGSNPGAMSFVAYVTDTRKWIDTLFRGRIYGGSLGGIYDSVEDHLFYRVVAVTNKGDGPTSLPDSVQVRSPILTSAWSPNWNSAPLPIGVGAIDSLGSSLAVLLYNDTATELWTSPDGRNWSLLKNFSRFADPVFWKGSIWWTTNHETKIMDTLFTNWYNDVYAVSLIDSVVIHRFDGSKVDSVRIQVKGDSVTSGTLAPMGNALAMLETQARYNQASDMGYSDFGIAWSTSNGSSWSQSTDPESAWWVRMNRSRYYSNNLWNIAQISVTFGPKFPVFLYGSDSTALWTSPNLLKPTGLEVGQYPSGAIATVLPAISALTGFDSTLVFLSRNNFSPGLRWAPLAIPTQWHEIQKPSPNLQAVQIWRGQILTHDGKTLWMAPIPLHP